MATLRWYVHRLGAMHGFEIVRHVRNRIRHVADARRTWTMVPVAGASTAAFPRLPAPGAAPPALRTALERDTAAILTGRWRFFGGPEIPVDDPPLWHRDYLGGVNVPSAEPGFRLDHRSLPAGADIKLVWELSRWNELVRLAMAAYTLGNGQAATRCLDWLEDWVRNNPPYRGWNWTSPLEAGLRLIQFAWIDALLARSGVDTSPHEERARRLGRLRGAVLAPHLWYAWRHRSFGSSANNHLLGELAGCIAATARWPDLASFAAPLAELQAAWEREVLAQFAEDGGNREQALNYHLFSLELCLAALAAVEASGRQVSAIVRERIRSAGAFYRDVQVSGEPWDYGDSDSAFVTPLFVDDPVPEWRGWLEASTAGAAVEYWVGEPLRGAHPASSSDRRGVLRVGDWSWFPHSGIALRKTENWCLRWDLSPLGYLSTAAHGHADALHLSVWLGETAFIIDPGTGAYYADTNLRSWLASRAAHNGPCPAGIDEPRRLGPFLWSRPHPAPELRPDGTGAVGTFKVGAVRAHRRIEHASGGQEWRVEDACCDAAGRGVPFTVSWQFAPDSIVTQLAEREFSVERHGSTLLIRLDGGWSGIVLAHSTAAETAPPGGRPSASMEGIVSPRFRQVCQAPFLRLATGFDTAGFCRTILSTPVPKP